MDFNSAVVTIVVSGMVAAAVASVYAPDRSRLTCPSGQLAVVTNDRTGASCAAPIEPGP